jgi:DHHC palmitoyltransferase
LAAFWRRPGFVNSMAWGLQVWMPQRYREVVERFGLEETCDRFGRGVNYWCCKKNYVVMLMYLVLVLGGFVVVLALAYPRLPNRFMSDMPHKPLGIVVMVACIVTFYLAAFTDPGVVTKANLDRHLNFSFDGPLYRPKVCRTCGILRPARSKHCAVLDRCVAKADHYCIWLVNHVGERSYRWFVLFLVVHTVMLLYGAVAMASILADVVVAHRLFDREFRHSGTKQVVKATYTIVLQYLMHHDGLLVAVFLLCAVMGLVLVFFSGYHLWLAGTNVTTNETFKYSDARDAYERALRRWQAHHGALAALRLRIAALDSLTTSTTSTTSPSAFASRPWAPVPAELGASDEVVAKLSPKEAIAELDEISAKSKAAASGAKDAAKVELEALRMLDWSRDPGARPVEPANVWSHGWAANYREVFFPLSDRSKADRDAHRKAFPGDYSGHSLLRSLQPDELQELVVAAHEPDVTIPTKLREALHAIHEQQQQRRAAAAENAENAGKGGKALASTPTSRAAEPTSTSTSTSSTSTTAPAAPTVGAGSAAASNRKRKL